MSEEEMNEEIVEEKDVEVLDFGLDDEAIDELMGKLNELKANKGTIEFDIDEDYSLNIAYEETGEEENDA